MRTSPFVLELVLEQLAPYQLTLYQVHGMNVFPLYAVSGSLLNAALIILVPQNSHGAFMALPIRFSNAPAPHMTAIRYAAENFAALASAVRPDSSFPNPYTEEELLQKAKDEWQTSPNPK